MTQEDMNEAYSPREDVRPSDAPSLEGLFDVQSESQEVENADGVQKEAQEEQEQVETQKEDSGEELPDETQESDEEERDADEENDVFKSLKEENETLKQQYKNTRDWATQVNSKATLIMEKVARGEDVSQEELNEIQELVGQNQKSQEAIETVVKTINEQLPVAKSVAMDATGKSEQEIDDAIAAFNFFAGADVALRQELLETPPERQAAYVIKRGQQLANTFKKVSEKGSIVGALTDQEASLQQAIEEAEKAGYERAKKELKQNNGNSSKPKLRNSGGEFTETENKQGDGPSLASIFG